MQNKSVIPTEIIQNKIFIIRGKKVMLSFDLAKLYNAEVRVLIQSVKRNIERFPDDFLFQLNDSEYKILKSQIVISSWGGARRSLPYAFTEQGVAMLSSVLRSKQAIQVNIQIMRTFTKIRELIITHKDLRLKIQELEDKYKDHDQQISTIFEAIRQLLEPPPPKQKTTAGLPVPVG